MTPQTNAIASKTGAKLRPVLCLDPVEKAWVFAMSDPIFCMLCDGVQSN
jgi:hypothetical protein